MSNVRAYGSKTLLYLVLAIGSLVSVFPYLWAVSTAFKPENEVFSGGLLPSHPTLTNFIYVLNTVPFLRYIWNTLFVAAVSVAGQLVFGSLAAYAFARMRFIGRNVIFLMYLSTLMIPNIVTLIPLFLITRQLGWIDTYAGIIAPTMLGTPVGIFLLRQFFMGIPVELEEAARIDGAGTFRILLQIIVPLSRPILATLSIITFVSSWNNFLWPLIVTNSDQLKMVSLGVATFQTAYGTQWNYMMAASTMALLPLLGVFIVFQRRIVDSIQLTGLK